MFGLLRSIEPVLAGEMIELRLPNNQDYLSWLALRVDSKAELVPFEPQWDANNLSRSRFNAKVKQAKILARQQESFQFLVFLKGSRVLLGRITLGNIRRGAAQSGEIGYWLGTKYSRQGYMRDSVFALIKFAFSRLGLHRIEAACIQENQRSIALLKHCGFHHEGIARAYLEINGQRQDHLLYARLASVV